MCGVHACMYIHNGACILVLAGFVLSAIQVEVTHVCAIFRQCEAPRCPKFMNKYSYLYSTFS